MMVFKDFLQKVRLIGGGASLAVAIFALAGCGTSTSSHQTKPVPVPPTNVLTGMPGINGPVLFVKIDDTDVAHPQVGIDKADVVYIEQVEGGLTRLAAVFSNALPPLIGPVRSARISDIDLMANYGRPGLAFSGAQKLFLPVLRAANIEDIGAEHEPPSIYSRDSTRQAPTDMMLNPSALLKKSIDVEHRKISTASSVGWKFGEIPKSGTPIKSATIHWPAAAYKVQWSKTENRWLLFHNGKPDVASDGKVLGSPTFIIQQVSITPSIYHDHNNNFTPFSQTTGTGSGYLLRDGQSFPIVWNRASPTAPTIWTLKDGTEALFQRGPIWIALTDQLPDFVPVAATAGTPKPSGTK